MRDFIKKYLVQTNVWVATSASCLMAFVQLAFFELNFSLIGLLFFGTILIYNIIRINEYKSILNRLYIDQFQWILIGFLGSVICLWYGNFKFEVYLYLAFLLLLSLGYSFPFSSLGLRAIPLIKLFLIALVWTGSTVGLSVLYFGNDLNFLFSGISIFLFIVGITIPFDIRDLNSDNRSLQTIPQILGVNFSKLISMLSLILSGLIFGLFVTNSTLILSWSLTILIAIVGVFFSNEKRSDFYYAFWIESISITPLIILLIIHAFIS